MENIKIKIFKQETETRYLVLYGGESMLLTLRFRAFDKKVQSKYLNLRIETYLEDEVNCTATRLIVHILQQ